MYGSAQFPSIGGRPSTEANRPNYTDALALAPGHIWVSGLQGVQDYVARLTSAGQPDATFASGKAAAVGDDGFGWVASIVPRPGGGAFLLSRISGFAASPIWPVRAMTTSGRSDTKWGHGGSASAVPPDASARCSAARPSSPVRCSPTAASGWQAASMRSSTTETQTPPPRSSSASPPPAGPTPRWARTGGPGWPDPPSVGSAGCGLRPARPDLLPGRPGAGRGLRRCLRLHPKIVRTNRNGVLDAKYETGGVSTLPMPTGATPANGWSRLLVSQSGTAFAAFDAKLASGRVQARLVSVRPSGALNTSFGSHGSAAFAPRVGNAHIGPVISAGDGTLLLGSTYTGGTRVRYLLLRVSATTGRFAPGFGAHGAMAMPRPINTLLRQLAHRLLVLLRRRPHHPRPPSTTHHNQTKPATPTTIRPDLPCGVLMHLDTCSDHDRCRASDCRAGQRSRSPRPSRHDVRRARARPIPEDPRIRPGMLRSPCT